MVRGVRGAIQVSENNRQAILTAAEELLRAVVEANLIRAEQVASVFFTVTRDLDAAFPAEARTALGWKEVPFLCSQEIDVPDALPRIIRLLVLFETDKSQGSIRHKYLGVAARLRPDLNQ